MYDFDCMCVIKTINHLLCYPFNWLAELYEANKQSSPVKSEIQEMLWNNKVQSSNVYMVPTFPPYIPATVVGT